MKKIIKLNTKDRYCSIEIESDSIIQKLNVIISKNKKTIFLIDKKVFYIFKKIHNYKDQAYFCINCSEKIKSFDHYSNLTQKILNKNIDRNSVLVSIGGGTLGDLSGFIASTILRGINLILVPTTLLSQVDSSIGGKNGINTSKGKNLVGSFYQPNRVLIDPIFLKTLSKREIRSGYAEIVKHGIINDSKFFDWLDNNSSEIIKLKPKKVIEAIYKSILIKRKYVLKDEKENRDTKYSRAILNFGHTFGHALETFYNYNKKLTHGEAISIGMSIASMLSFKLKYLSEINLIKINNHFKKNKLPTSDKMMYNSKIFEIIKKDKKNIDERINFILIKKLGMAFVSKKMNIKLIRSALIKS
tara:strand:- start:108 stop:1181 length:1074 start_codon:yes stop_codon:yes gene_type:complete